MSQRDLPPDAGAIARIITPGMLPADVEAMREAFARTQRWLHQRNINRRRYARRFRSHAPPMRRAKTRTPAQRARAITRQAIEVKRFMTVGVLFRGALEWLRGHAKPLAEPHGQYHSPTKKGPGRRPLRPRHETVEPTHGAKWLQRGFPRGY